MSEATKPCPFEALGAVVIIVPAKEPEKSKLGIIIPENSRRELAFADVVAVGPAVTMLKPGDRIPFSPYGGQDFDHEGVKYKFLNEADIPAKLAS